MVLSALLTLACLSCTDNNPHLPDATGAALEVTPELRCTVDVGSAILSCTEAGPAGANGASYALLGNASVKLRSANNIYDSLSLVYSFDVTVQNLLKYNIGTPDGQTRAGLKVFFERVPYVTAYKSPGDTGTVTLTNHDGTQNFTAATQPYFLYDTILAPQAITNAKRWEFRVPRTVQNFGFSVRVFTATTAEQKVPLTAPNSRPSWFNTPASLIRYGNSQIMVVKNVVRVEFRPDASQEERQSAVDMVGGSVVGGGAGFYYVRVPSNGTLPSLESYFVTLSRLPQVRSATPFITSGAIEVSYQKAYDTVGWREWQLNPDSANNQNWALERIGAPFAWGCSCGDTLTKVAVIDQGFHAQPDLEGNADLAQSVGWNAYAGAADTIDHGTRVAAILAASGNDSSQITGTMWGARLLLYDASTDSAGAPMGGLQYENVWAYLRRAGRQGARVINMSLGLVWRDSLNNLRNPALETDSVKRHRDSLVLVSYRRDLETSLDSLVAQGHDPLLVVSAGNNPIDARWTGFETTTHANRILHVGSSNIADGLSSFSSIGPLVEIAAPGEGVHVLWGNGLIDKSRTLPSGNIRHGNGTSFSAPHVAGVAGLMFSFDPRLTALDVKRLLIQGAVRGNRAAGGIPILNAHESLILAARRAGAPLCGNRLWIANGNFFAQRDTASTTGEELFPSGSGAGRAVAFNAMHGGKQVMLYTRPTRTGRGWTVNGWTPIPFSDAGPGHNASFLSRAGRSHEGDTTVVLLREAGTTPRTEAFRPAVRTAAGEFPLPVVITDSAYQEPAVCLARFVEVTAQEHSDFMNTDEQTRIAYEEWLGRRGQPGNCMHHGNPQVRVETLKSIAYAPVGQQAYAFIIRRRATTQLTGSNRCAMAEVIQSPGGTQLGTVDFTADCYSAVTTVASAGTTGYRIDIRAGTITPLSWSEPSLEIAAPMIHENGREALLERTSYEAVNGTVTRDECRLQFRDLLSGIVHMSPGICGPTGGHGGFGAVRAPGGG